MSQERVRVNVGDVLGGKYRVKRILGAGGVGVVLLAQHLELRQRVALKLLHKADDPDDVARFMREARSAVRLKSEHCVRVTDVGRLKDGAPFMVMEYLDGEDLAAVLERGPLPIAEAVDYILQACEGIAEAHAIGIVHRDLKPRNLFLARQVHGTPRIKVVDFGLAKSFSPNDDKTLTATTAVMGSPQYMSPEQMRASRDVDKRTDIWSLGVCLYELLTGTAPFDGATIPELCVRVMTEAPFPIRRIRPDIPEDLSMVVDQCLEKDPAHRFATVVELATALQPFASSRGASERVAAVFYAIPTSTSGVPPEGGDAATGTMAAVDTTRAPTLVSGSLWIGLVAGAAAGVLGVLVAILAFWPRGEHPRPPTDRGFAASTPESVGMDGTSVSPPPAAEETESPSGPAGGDSSSVPSAGIAGAGPKGGSGGGVSANKPKSATPTPTGASATTPNTTRRVGAGASGRF